MSKFALYELQHCLPDVLAQFELEYSSPISMGVHNVYFGTQSCIAKLRYTDVEHRVLSQLSDLDFVPNPVLHALLRRKHNLVVMSKFYPISSMGVLQNTYWYSDDVKKSDFSMEDDDILYRGSVVTSKKDFYRNLRDCISDVHKRGVSGIDITPQNVFVSKDGKPRLIDFDIARGRKRVCMGKRFNVLRKWYQSLDFKDVERLESGERFQYGWSWSKPAAVADLVVPRLFIERMG